jgi:hypothetical protein
MFHFLQKTSTQMQSPNQYIDFKISSHDWSLEISHIYDSMWKIISVDQTQNLETFCGFNIDFPRIINRELEISGWVLGKISPVKNIIISLEENAILEMTSPNLICEDIANIFVQIENAEQSGFSIKINLQLLPILTTLIVSAKLENGQNHELGKIVLEYDKKTADKFLLQYYQQKTGRIISIEQQSCLENFHGFHIDLPNLQDIIFENHLEIHGWILEKNIPISRLVVKTEDTYQPQTILATTIPNLIREDVAQLFPDIENAQCAGFFLNVNLEETTPICYLEISALLEDNIEHLLAIIKIQNYYQKIPFKISQTPEQLSSKLHGFHIDFPIFQKSFLEHEFYDLEISGWILGKDIPVSQIEIVDSNHHILKTIPIQYQRSDVAQSFQAVENSNLSGFSVLINLLMLPMQTTISLVARLADESQVNLTHFNIQRFPLHTLYQPTLKPLIINSLGRSGTTWIMHLLAQHLKIATYKNYPYELPVIEHYVHNILIHNLFESYPDQIPYPELDVNDLFKLNRHRMYHVKEEPLKRYFRKQQIEELAYFCQEQIDKYIEQILNFQKRIGEGLENPIYFAEKLINPSRDTEYLSRLIWELYPQGKEIILVRDFRDMFCSVLSFMKKRDLKICFGLDFQHAQTEEEYVKITKERINFIWDCWETRKHKAYLVRYEDLIEKPLPILKGIFEYLNLDHDEATLQTILHKASLRNAEMSDHITSSTVDASLGRWKKDLSPALQRLCNEAFQPALEAFGYSVETY